jgi:hypothetical protein
MQQAVEHIGALPFRALNTVEYQKRLRSSKNVYTLTPWYLPKYLKE